MLTSEANLGLSLGLRDQHEVTTFHLYKMRNVLLYIILAHITHTYTSGAIKAPAVMYLHLLCTQLCCNQSQEISN